ncbi:MAG: TauD/TfdA dioxygenase family protein [Microthrixaceae bacterium]
MVDTDTHAHTDTGAATMQMTDAEQATTPQALAGLARVNIKRRRNAELGPHTHLAERRAELDAMQWSRFELTPAGTTIGAAIGGIDLGSDLDDATISELRAALVAHKVLVFRDQALDASSQSNFASRFGELEHHPFLGGTEETPYLVRLAKDESVGGYENIWHSDVTWREEPAMGAVLRAVDVPAYGGDTLWADMGAAYNGLTDSMKERLEGLSAVHDFMLSYGAAMSPQDREAARFDFPAVEHPVVRTHPESGEKVLYVNRIFTSHIVGMDDDESEMLLDHLFSRAEIAEYQFRLRWEPGTVAMWDNRSTQHYASSDYWPQPRVMERAAIIGDRPS